MCTDLPYGWSIHHTKSGGCYIGWYPSWIIVLSIQIYTRATLLRPGPVQIEYHARSCKLFVLHYAIPLNPQCNDLVEILNLTLIGMLTTTVHEHTGDWDRHLWQLCMAYDTCSVIHRLHSILHDVWKTGQVTHRCCQRINTPKVIAMSWIHTESEEYRLDVAYSKVREHLGTTKINIWC